MDHVKLVLKEPTAQENAFLDDRINRFNVNVTGIPFGGSVAVFAYDDRNEVIGGVNGWKWGDAFAVSVLWVEESWRGQGIGARILAAIEAAAAPACTQIMLDTHDFQAIDFYLKRGYEVIGTIENFPTPYTRYFLRKRVLPLQNT